jgi:hypothetical protein
MPSNPILQACSKMVSPSPSRCSENRIPSVPRQDFLQFCFALFKRMLPVILAIQFEQVEGIQEDLIVMSIGMQLVEVGLALPASPHRLPVWFASSKSQTQPSFNNRRAGDTFPGRTTNIGNPCSMGFLVACTSAASLACGRDVFG